jgi:5-formyltetrahydrofolate cyclo-ligase
MSTSLQIEAEKQVLRARMRAARAAIVPEERKRAAEAIARHGLDFLAMAPANVGGYHPVRSELDCLPLLKRLADEAWRLALPAIDGEAPLEFRRWSFGAPLAAGRFGIQEPPPGDPVSPALLLVPLLAYDSCGFRLGYGGGYYDRTLAALRRAGPVTAIGLAFDTQAVEEVPVGPYDEPLDFILTPSGVLSSKDR